MSLFAPYVFRSPWRPDVGSPETGGIRGAYVLKLACEDQRTTFRTWFSPTMWRPGVELRSFTPAAQIML